MTHRIGMIIISLIIFPVLVGFNLDNAIVAQSEILSGGPPKDGIPALLQPSFLPAEKATYLRESDQVIGVALDGAARAYPINILNWHEAVNDTLAGQPIVVTF